MRSGLLTLFLLSAVIPAAGAMDLTRNGRLILSGDVNSSAELWVDAPNRQGLCLVRLRERIVHKIACEQAFRPKIISHHHGRIGRFADVVVIQEQPQGNACDGGSLHILGIANDHRVAPVKVIDYCGGPDPVFARQGDALRITLPGGKPNRGSDAIPQTVWTFRNGTLSKEPAMAKSTAASAPASAPAGRVISRGPSSQKPPATRTEVIDGWRVVTVGYVVEKEGKKGAKTCLLRLSDGHKRLYSPATKAVCDALPPGTPKSAMWRFAYGTNWAKTARSKCATAQACSEENPLIIQSITRLH